MCQNARYQLEAQLLGKVATLTPGEIKLAGSLNALPNVTNRTWEYWTLRLDKAGGLPPKPRPAAASMKGKASGRKGASGAKRKAGQKR